ncbi:MAG TPA: thioredoxin domain-containing protein [Candidatus Saccharimonadales bacterium]|jgi:protein-disulfide isomerase
MDKRFWAILGVIAVIVVGAIWISDRKAGAPTSNTPPTNHVEGTSTTGVKLVEYGDFQCIYCTQYYPIVKQVVAEYSKQISFQFRNFPLTQLHPNAFAGARAAEAAGLQGKFWQMHDLLYDQGTLYYNDNASTWDTASDPEADFVQYAGQLGLNVAQFKQDYASDKVNNLINADVTAGSKLNVTGTPAFFIGGKQIHPTESIASFTKLINAAIKQKGFTPKPISTASTSASATSSTNASTAPQSKQ